MAEPVPPYFVLFSADRIPTQVDHTQRSPGGPNHAGHTSVNFNGQRVLTFVSDTTAPRADGMVGFYFRSVNVMFRLTDFSIALSSDYAVGSCAYNATLAHELDAHVRGPIRIMYGFRDRLVQQLNAIPLPTESAPRWIRPQEAASVQDVYQRQVYAVVAAMRQQVSSALDAARRREDSPAHYQRVYDQCPRVEWTH